MRRLSRILSLCFLIATAVLLTAFLTTLTGCAVDPQTGKKVLSPATTQTIVHILQSPEVQAGASALPYGLGALGTAAISLVLGYMSKQQSNAHQALKDVATHAITTAAEAAAGAIQADSGVTVTTNGSAGARLTLPPGKG